MELVILGAGTALPVPGKSAAGHLLRVGETPLLFDIGPGTIARLSAAGVSYRDLEYVFLSHHHSDHTLDLVTFLQANDSTPGWTRQRPLHIIGCPGTRQFYQKLMEVYPGIAPQTYQLDLREIETQRTILPFGALQAAFTRHTENSMAYRLEAEDKTFVYSGDAVETAELVALARGADLFVCECSFPKGWASAEHLNAAQVGRIARAAGVKQVVLTHQYPPALAVDLAAQVRDEYDGPVTVASDGMRLVF